MQIKRYANIKSADGIETIEIELTQEEMKQAYKEYKNQMTEYFLLSYDGYFGDMDIRFTDKMVISKEMLEILNDLLVQNEKFSVNIYSEPYQKSFSLKDIISPENLKQLNVSEYEVFIKEPFHVEVLETFFEELIENVDGLGDKFLESWNKL